MEQEEREKLLRALRLGAVLILLMLVAGRLASNWEARSEKAHSQGR
jgi:hypothetical protein